MINFQMYFAAINGQWKLFGLVADVGPSGPVAPTPDTPELQSSAPKAPNPPQKTASASKK